MWARAACSLVQQTSRAANCTLGVSYGCDEVGVWVTHGCRGTFRSNGSPVTCDRPGNPWTHCPRSRRVLYVKPASEARRPKPQTKTWLLASPKATEPIVAILVAVVAGPGLEVQKRALRGMEAADAAYSALHARIDWAVISYDDTADLWGGTMKASSRLQRTTLVLMCERLPRLSA